MADDKTQTPPTDAPQQIAVVYKCVSPFSAWGKNYNAGDVVRASDWVGKDKTSREEAAGALRRRIEGNYVAISEV
jgi:hypothetical protein